MIEKEQQQPTTQASQTTSTADASAKETMKAMENQIKLQFQSFSSNLTAEKQAEIEKWLGKRAVKNRVYLIRHGKSKEDQGTQNIQSSAAELTPEAKQQFKQIAEDLKKLGLNSENTYMMYHDGEDNKPMVRIIESAEIIQKELGIGLDRVDARVLGLDTTDKDDLVQTSRFVATAKDVADCCREISLKMGNGELDPATSDGARMGNVNVVCVIHKSNIGAIRSYFFKEENKPVDLGHGGYQNGEIQEVDFIGDVKKLRKDGLEGADVLNYNVDKTILNLNSSNLNGWLAYTLMKEEELKGYLKQFRAGKLQIFELQNLVNVYFRKTEGLFEKYMLSDSYDMRVFCVANLVANGKWEMGSFDYAQDKSGKLKKLLEMESETSLIRLVDDLFRIFDEEQSKEFVDFLVEDGKVGSWLNEKVKQKKLEFYLNYRKHTRFYIGKLREKTLDARITRGENVIVPLGFKGDSYKNMEQLLHKDGITLIEGEAGAGKSTKLMEIMEYLKPREDNNLFPIYISLGDKDIDHIKRDISTQKSELLGAAEYKFVYLFDGLDEAGYDDEAKKEFLGYVYDNLDGRVIIASRLGVLSNDIYSSLSEKGYEIDSVELLKFDSEQTEDYMKRVLDGQYIDQWNMIKNKDFIDTDSVSPLILSMIVEYLSNGEKVQILLDQGLLEEKDLLLENKMDLYKVVVLLRLYTWEKKKEEAHTNKSTSKYTVLGRKSILARIAYDSILNKVQLKKRDIDSIIEEINPTAIPTDKNEMWDLRCLNLIFRNIDKNYIFVHRSFLEYFFFLGYTQDREKWLNNLNNDLLNNGGIGYNVVELLQYFDKTRVVAFLNDLVGLEGFKNDRKAILYVCRLIARLEEPDSVDVLHKILKLDGFKNHRRASVAFSLAVLKIGTIEGLNLFNELITLEGFKDNKKAVNYIFSTLETLKHGEGLLILEKLLSLNWIKNDGNIITESCSILNNDIIEKEGLKVVERLLNMEGFKNNELAIIRTCGFIGKLQDERGLELLDKIVDIDLFKNSEDAIFNACLSLRNFGLPRGFSIIEKIIEAPAFGNREQHLIDVCEYLKDLGEERGLDIIEKIVDLDIFQNSYYSIHFVCILIENLNHTKGLDILEKLIYLEEFGKNKHKVSLMCRFAIGTATEKGVNILRNIIKTEYFLNNERAITEACYLINYISEDKLIEILWYLLNMDSFNKSSVSVHNSIMSICRFGSQNTYQLLVSLLKLDSFKYINEMLEDETVELLNVEKNILPEENLIKALCVLLQNFESTKVYDIIETLLAIDFVKNSKNSIEDICILVSKVWDQRGVDVFKDIIKLPVFYQDREMVNNFTGFIHGIEYITEKQQLELITELLDKDGFKNNEIAINNSCIILMEIGLDYSFEILTKIFLLEGFKLSLDAQKNISSMINENSGEKGFDLLDEILRGDIFLLDEDLIHNICITYIHLGDKNISKTIEHLDIIISLEAFKSNPVAVKNIVILISQFEDSCVDERIEIMKSVIVNESFYKKEENVNYALAFAYVIGRTEGLDLIYDIVSSGFFISEFEIVQAISFVLWERGDLDLQKTLDIFEKLLITEGIDENQDFIQNAFLIAGEISEINMKRSVEITYKLLSMKGFENNDGALTTFSAGLIKIKDENLFQILEEIILQGTYPQDEVFLFHLCAAIGSVSSVRGLKMLEKIIDAEGFEYGEGVIQTACLAIGDIEEKKGLNILKKIVSMKGFTNKTENLEAACHAICQIGDREGLELLGSIVMSVNFDFDEELVDNINQYLSKFSEDGNSYLLLNTGKIKNISK